MTVALATTAESASEPLHLNGEQGGVTSGTRTVSASRAGSATDRLVPRMKQNKAQKELGKVPLGRTELWNTLHCKYLGVMQSGDGNMQRARSRKRTFTSLQKTLTDRRLLEKLRVRPWRSTTIATLLHGCESWTITDNILNAINGTASKTLANISGRTIAEEAASRTCPVIL